VKTKVVAAAALACLLAACAGVPPRLGPANEAAWQQRLDALRGLDHWQLEGSIGIVNNGRGGSGAISWVERAPWLEMRFSGPFGIGGFRLSGEPHDLLIETGKGKTYRVTNPRLFLARRLGWPVPIDSLRYWVLGMPAPGVGTDAIRVDRHGLLRSLSQDGWQIEYRTYTGGSRPMPLRIDAASGNVKIKLAIERWHLPATPPAN
jgi:outer membrane lipoprotein LolB